MIRIKKKGDFKHTMSWLNQLRKRDLYSILNKYGKMGVEALSAATPRDTGKTAESWYYDINVTPYASTIVFKNSNVVENVYTTKNGVQKTSYIPVVILIQYGHAKHRGDKVKVVQGRDFINPTIQPIFDKMAEEAWEEVTAL